MREKLADIGILAFALLLLAAIVLPGMPVHYADESDLPAVRTISGGGIVVEDGTVLIDVNEAGADLLMELPGVGEVMAQRIIAHRLEYGPFSCAEDLLDVKGIGPATLEKLRPHISLR